MSSNALFQHPYLVLALTSILVNIPLGYIRANYPKFSFAWLLWIHASIPLIVYLRITLGVSKLLIPVWIFLAVLGQIWGSRWRNHSMSQKKRESLQQIPPINVSRKESIPDSEVLVALLNMGGPRTNTDVRDFQRRLFSDKLLIRFPMSWAFQGLFVWLLVAFRSRAAEERYRLIGGGSPIFDSTKDQNAALQEELHQRGRNLHVTFSFNYSSPLPDEIMHGAKAAGKKYILPLSLYPHYSKATTGSSVHYLKESAAKICPEIQFLDTPSYYLHYGYIEAFAGRIREQLRPGESLDDFYLLFSAHGLPLYFLKEGDVYPFQVAQTVSGVVTCLNRQGGRWSLAYQSAVGPLQWLKPSTEDMLAALAKRNVKKVLVVPISFVTDHIETTCEIDIEYRAFAENLGITDFRMSRAIECHPGFIQALADSVEAILPNKNKNRTDPSVRGIQTSPNI